MLEESSGEKNCFIIIYSIFPDCPLDTFNRLLSIFFRMTVNCLALEEQPLTALPHIQYLQEFLLHG
jgi:hypothetical protein